MFKKVAMLVSLIALSVPLFVGEGFIEPDWDNNPVVIAYDPANPSDSPFDCAGYPIPEDKPERCDNVDHADKLPGTGKVAHPVDIVICRIPCGGDPIF